jgi:hypothetical protein
MWAESVHKLLCKKACVLEDFPRIYICFVQNIVTKIFTN